MGRENPGQYPGFRQLEAMLVWQEALQARSQEWGVPQQPHGRSMNRAAHWTAQGCSGLPPQANKSPELDLSIMWYPSLMFSIFCSCFFKRVYLFIFRERGREGERGRETSVCGCLSRTPYWGPGLQPRHVPWLGIKPMTLCFTGPFSIHWATPARAQNSIFNEHFHNMLILRAYKHV